MGKEKELRLLPYQKEITEIIVKTWTAKSVTLLSIAVGLGRTVTITWALNQLFRKSEFKRALIITPVSILREQFIQILNKYSANEALVLKFDKHTKSVLSQEFVHEPIILVTTLAMFRKLVDDIPSNFFDLVFIDDCQRMSDKDWSKVGKLKSPLIAITSIHPLKISKKMFSVLGKKAPDYSYGISSIQLRDIAEIRTGATYSTKQLLSEGTWKFFRPRDIKKSGFLETTAFISNEVARKKIKSSLKVGDIVLQNIFSFGKMAIVREEDLPAIASQNLFIIRSKTIPPDILFEYIQSKAIADAFRKQLEDISHGIVIRRISLRDVRQIPVPLPFSKEQIIEFGTINSIQNLRELERSRNKLAHLLNAYKQHSGIEE